MKRRTFFKKIIIKGYCSDNKEPGYWKLVEKDELIFD